MYARLATPHRAARSGLGRHAALATSRPPYSPLSAHMRPSGSTSLWLRYADRCLGGAPPPRVVRSLIMNESNFQHILRVLNTNLDGKVKVMFALTSIKGVGRRFSNIACKKAEVDLNKRCAPAPRPPRRPTSLRPRPPHPLPPPFRCAHPAAVVCL